MDEAYDDEDLHLGGGAECREKAQRGISEGKPGGCVYENNVGHEGNGRKTKMSPVITV